MNIYHFGGVHERDKFTPLMSVLFSVNLGVLARSRTGKTHPAHERPLRKKLWFSNLIRLEQGGLNESLACAQKWVCLQSGELLGSPKRARPLRAQPK